MTTEQLEQAVEQGRHHLAVTNHLMVVLCIALGVQFVVWVVFMARWVSLGCLSSERPQDLLPPVETRWMRLASIAALLAWCYCLGRWYTFRHYGW